MRPSRVLQRVLGTPARERRISLLWAVPGAALAVGVIVLLAVLISSASSARTDPIDPAHQPTILEGPTNRIALRAGWVLARDPTNRGLSHGWAQGRFAGGAVSVPHVANATPITGAAGIKNYAGSIAWYRTTFTTPASGGYSVRFESVNFRADVWLDGKHLGSAHLGTYLPFEYHFNAGPGSHLLVVRADYRDPNAQSLAGYHRTWFNFGGINGEVTVRPLGPSDLVNPTITTTLPSGASGPALVTVGVEVHNNAPDRTLTPTGTLSDENGQTDLKFGPVTVAQGHFAVAQAQVTIDNPSLWSPSSPHLYDMDLKIGDESEYRLKVGLRQVSGSGGTLTLNGAPLILRGASIQEDIRGHGDALTPDDQTAIVNELKALGANATRSQHPLDLALLEKLDAAGILVWQGVGPVDPSGAWLSNTPALERLAEKRARVTIRQAQTHPSIIAWNLANEVAGNGHPGGQALYVEDVASWIHTNDPGRLVALDIWGPHPPRIAGPIYDNVDAIGETNYLGWYESPLVPQTVLSGLIRQRLDSLHATFPGKVLIVSEFGAEANYLNPTPSPGSYGFQARLLATHIAVYRSLPYLAGMLVWDLRDFAVSPAFAGGSIRHSVAHIALVRGLNQKGLISYEGVEKDGFATVKQAFASAAKSP
ncbi:MAG TPA: glycoside hydrolase family 2 TIM barrel-domain containing protein [Solirubrobacteraceae bacterium]|nr:glycoside hydrolase family 2 TIM barrel-domain containing protein [Solirubrobacteraceae bacterium]